MDIISEILETDKLAEEKLEQALRQRSEMLAECEKKTEQIKKDAKIKAENYRKELSEISDSDADARASELKESEQAKIKGFEELYDKNHEAWEKEIISSITG